jgi:non-homologous end joining protein Ku
MNKPSNEVQFVATTVEEGVPYVLLITTDFHEAYKAGYEYLLKAAKGMYNKEYADELVALIQPILDLLNSETDPDKLGDEYKNNFIECCVNKLPVQYTIEQDLIEESIISISPYPDSDALVG